MAQQVAFIEALQNEHVLGNNPDAVGQHYARYGFDPQYMQYEQAVKQAPNKAAAIDDVARKLRVHVKNYDEDSGAGSSSGSEDSTLVKGPISVQPASIRRGFIQKVYSILTVQLLLTIAIVYPFVTQLSQEWVAQNISVYYGVTLGSLALMIGVVCCCQSVMRVFPWNYIFLLLMTVGIGVMVGFACMLYTVSSILQALAATAFVFLSLTAYACFTKTDFTGLGPYLYTALMGLIGFSMIMWIWSMFGPVPPFMQTVGALLGVLLFSFYIVYDTQLVVGGNHKQQFDVDDYVLAALNLYLDIINMFLYLLQLLGKRN